MPQHTKLKRPILVHAASLACMLHCIATPLISVIAPALASRLHHPLLEVGLLASALSFGLYIIYSGYCTHKKTHASILFLLGIGIWIFASITEHLEHEYGHHYLIFIGIALVSLSYIVNHRFQICCPNHKGCC